MNLRIINYLDKNYRNSFIGANDWRMVESEYLRMLGDFTTIRGTAFHKTGYKNFRFSFKINGFHVGNEIFIGFGKQFELSSPDNCNLSVCFSDNSIRIAYNGKTIEKKCSPSLKNCIMFDGEYLYVMSGDNEITIKALSDDLIGYASIWSVYNGDVDRTVELQRGCEMRIYDLSLTSDFEVVPETNEESENNEKDWLLWQSEQTERIVTDFENYCKEHSELLPKPQGNIIINEKMVDKNTKQKVSFVWFGTSMPKAYIKHNYFAENAENQVLSLDFVKKENAFYADMDILFSIAGNTLIQLSDGINEISRVVSVYERGYLVLAPWIGDNRPIIDSEIHKYNLPGDYEWQIHNPITTPFEEILSKTKKQVEMYYNYGDRIAAGASFYEFFPGTTHWNTYEVDSVYQKKIIDWSIRMMKAMGIDNIETLAGYTNNHITAEIAEEFGIKAFTNMCIWQNWADAGMGHINHWGAANAPYCPGYDDIRRCADNNRRIIATSIGTSSNVRNWGIMAQDGCPTLTCGSQRYSGNEAQIHNAQRFFDTFDGYMHDVKNNGDLFIVKICIENFIGSDDWRRANENAIDYMVNKAKNNKILFASVADISDYYMRHNIVMPETVFIQHDFYCGMYVDAKPGMLPVRIEWENKDFMAQFAEGKNLPEFLFDYNVPWNGPMWEDGIRNEEEVIDLTKCPPVTLFPPQMDNRDTTVSAEVRENEKEISVVFSVKNKSDKKYLPLAQFNLNLSEDAKINFCSSGEAKLLKDGFNENYHLLVRTTELAKGENVIVVKIHGNIIKNQEIYFDFDNGLCAKQVNSEDGIHTYLWSSDKQTSLTVILNTGFLPQNAYLKQNNGMIMNQNEGNLLLNINNGWENEAPILFNVGLKELKKAIVEVRKC